MQQMVKDIRSRNRRLLLVSCFVVLTATLLGTVFVSARTQESRPRNTQTSAPRPTPPATTTPATPAATATPAASQTPKQVDRIAPTLGEPPPPPKLKPTPTPTPPEEFDKESIIKFNTELVYLQVRVIDR